MNLKNEFNGIWQRNPEYSRTVCSGMRPTFKIVENYMTSGKIECNDPLNDGDLISVQLISPEYYPNSLSVGKCIEAFDGSRQMGTITVKEIFNPILDGDERK